MYYQLQIKST